MYAVDKASVKSIAKTTVGGVRADRFRYVEPDGSFDGWWIITRACTNDGAGLEVYAGARKGTWRKWESTLNKIVESIRINIEVRVDEESLECKMPPTQLRGRTMVPMRDIFEALGAQVEWDPSAKRITAKKGDTLVQLVAGDRHAKVDGRSVELDSPASILRGVTMVPLRFVGESFGASVNWNSKTRTVEITAAKKGASNEF
jgi:hypothetical protein